MLEALLGGGGSDAGDEADAEVVDAGGISYPDGGNTEGDAATGTNCGTEATTGSVLCTGISACPDITVDQSLLSGCGFRIRGGEVLDLECGCSGSLCPIGAPTTCAEATQLLQNQTLPSVCLQLSEGPLPVPGAATTTSTTSTCDQNCAANCVGAAPVCRCAAAEATRIRLIGHLTIWSFVSALMPAARFTAFARTCAS